MNKVFIQVNLKTIQSNNAELLLYEAKDYLDENPINKIDQLIQAHNNLCNEIGLENNLVLE